MTGRLLSSCRSGNLAEHLGLLLLKGIAAVADIPRTEDVGLDAVASLLRREKDGNCYAEDSFVVQFKSDSEKTVKYKDHELTWFLGQSQPMFIGRVSLKNTRISLYPTLFVNQAVLSLHAKKVIIKFGTSNIPSFITHRTSPWVGRSGNSATVWLGEPLLQWTLAEMVEKAWLQSAYEILKRFLGIARREYELLSFGQCSDLMWATNDKDSIRSSLMMGKGHADNLQSVVQRSMPALQALLILATGMPEERGNPLLISLISLAVALRDLRADIDKENPFLKIGVALLTRRATTDSNTQKPP